MEDRKDLSIHWSTIQCEALYLKKGDFWCSASFKEEFSGAVESPLRLAQRGRKSGRGAQWFPGTGGLLCVWEA